MKTKWSNEVIITYKGKKIEEVMLHKYISANGILLEGVEELAISKIKAS